MSERHCSFFALVCAGLALIGCGSDTSEKPVVETLDPVEPEQYYGTYAGRRIDLEESATPPSIEELIGSSTLTLHEGETTFSMMHDGIIFGGTYTYQTESDDDDRSFKTMLLTVSQIGSITTAEFEAAYVDAEAFAEAFPDSPERYGTYKLIMFQNVWRFEVLDDGFLQLDTPRDPIKYRFTRDDDRKALYLEQSSSESIQSNDADSDS